MTPCISRTSCTCPSRIVKHTPSLSLLLARVLLLSPTALLPPVWTWEPISGRHSYDWLKVHTFTYSIKSVIQILFILSPWNLVFCPLIPSSGPCQYHFRVTNRGRRSHQLYWTTEGYPQFRRRVPPPANTTREGKGRSSLVPPPADGPVFSLHPMRMELAPGHTADMVLEGSSDSPKVGTWDNGVKHSSVRHNLDIQLRSRNIHTPSKYTYGMLLNENLCGSCIVC